MTNGDTRIAAGGVSWLLTSSGPPSGRPVLLLHGFPEDRASWRAQLPPLGAAGYRAIAADLPGVGGTSEPRSYRIDAVAPTVAALARTLGDGVHIVGHDWGTILAAAAVAHDPRAFASVTLTGGPHPAAFRAALRSPRQLARSWYVAVFMVPGVEIAVAARGATLTRALFPVETPISTPAEARRALAYYRANFNPLAIARHRVGRITVPSLIVHGARDRYVGRELIHATAAQCDDLRGLEIVESGHFVHQERPDRWRDVLLRFLSTVDGAKGPGAR